MAFNSDVVSVSGWYEVWIGVSALEGSFQIGCHKVFIDVVQSSLNILRLTETPDLGSICKGDLSHMATKIDRRGSN